MDSHFVPGYFGGGPEPILERLASGTGGLRVLRWEGPETDSGAALATLRDPPAGNVRKLKGEARIPPGKPLALTVETFGAAAGRTFTGLRLVLPEDPGITGKDVEIVFLGLACAFLQAMDQGLAFLGPDLGPVGAGCGGGTLAEQARRLLDLHGGNVEVLIAAADTAAALGDLPGFARRRLGPAIEYRREA